MECNYQKRIRDIDYPKEGYFFKGEFNDGKSFTSDKNGCYGYQTYDECMSQMKSFINEHANEIKIINGPYIGCYI